MDSFTAHLFEPVQSHKALESAWRYIKAATVAGHRLVLTITEESQTRDQQELYHAMIGEISQQAKHLGSKWGPEDWKRLLLDKFARETGRSTGRIIPNLDGDGVVEVGILSRRFGKREASDFVEFLSAWGASNGVEFSERVDADTGEIC